MLRIVAVALVFVLAQGAAVAAQPNATPRADNAPVSLSDYTITNWSEEQGPFPFGIYAIAQDREGYLDYWRCRWDHRRLPRPHLGVPPAARAQFHR